MSIQTVIYAVFVIVTQTKKVVVVPAPPLTHYNYQHKISLEPMHVCHKHSLVLSSNFEWVSSQRLCIFVCKSWLKTDPKSWCNMEYVFWALQPEIVSHADHSLSWALSLASNIRRVSSIHLTQLFYQLNKRRSFVLFCLFAIFTSPKSQHPLSCSWYRWKALNE
jgi:hypothetical protein